MKYDFTSILDRNGKDSIAVNPPMEGGRVNFAPVKEGFDLIPMWVADMISRQCRQNPAGNARGRCTRHTDILNPRSEYYEEISTARR